MPAKKLKKSPSSPIAASKPGAKTVKKVSRKPSAAKVPVKDAKPALKSEKSSGLTGGFIRISETQIRKVYR